MEKQVIKVIVQPKIESSVIIHSRCNFSLLQTSMLFFCRQNTKVEIL